MNFKLRDLAVTVNWTIIPVLVMLLFIGVNLHAFLEGLGVRNDPFGTIVGFTFGALGFILAHELGHVLGFKLVGFKWKRLEFGFTSSVGSDEARKVWQQLVISVLGPLTQIVVSVLFIAVFQTQDWAIGLVIAAMVSAVTGIFGFVIPTSKYSDSAKIYKNAFLVLRGRAKEYTRKAEDQYPGESGPSIGLGSGTSGPGIG